MLNLYSAQSSIEILVKCQNHVMFFSFSYDENNDIITNSTQMISREYDNKIMTLLEYLREVYLGQSNNNLPQSETKWGNENVSLILKLNVITLEICSLKDM